MGFEITFTIVNHMSKGRCDAALFMYGLALVRHRRALSVSPLPGSPR
jgi:hypothetical protein